MHDILQLCWKLWFTECVHLDVLIRSFITLSLRSVILRCFQDSELIDEWWGKTSPLSYS